ncbi:hypothetical protein BRD17_00255 [Halobacteriales archaeon SW_7_68_16]|nr:MAG: hypothetical protein BRD17_00255 [Halobacteriales archaeon SW_7_68_16]
MRGNHALIERARSYFDRLGYAVNGRGPEFRAQRAWREVRVTVTDRPEPHVDGDGDLRCFVASAEVADDLRHRLHEADPDCEWAVVAVTGDDVEVRRAPPTAR